MGIKLKLRTPIILHGDTIEAHWHCAVESYVLKPRYST